MQSSERVILVVTVLSLLVCWSAVVSMAADDTDIAIDRALKGTGVTGQMDHLGQAILSAVPEDAFADKRIKSDAASFLKEHAGSEKLVSGIHAAIRDELDRETIDKVVGFCDSKLGKKAGRLQSTALEPSNLKKIREARPLLLSLGESRIVLLKRIIKAQDVLKFNAELLSTVVRGLAEGFFSQQHKIRCTY